MSLLPPHSVTLLFWYDVLSMLRKNLYWRDLLRPFDGSLTFLLCYSLAVLMNLLFWYPLGQVLSLKYIEEEFVLERNLSLFRCVCYPPTLLLLLLLSTLLSSYSILLLIWYPLTLTPSYTDPLLLSYPLTFLLWYPQSYFLTLKPSYFVPLLLWYPLTLPLSPACPLTLNPPGLCSSCPSLHRGSWRPR